eukprot:13317235-Alexandrium_andersonii.AAC.1
MQLVLEGSRGFSTPVMTDLDGSRWFSTESLGADIRVPANACFPCLALPGPRMRCTCVSNAS